MYSLPKIAFFYTFLALFQACSPTSEPKPPEGMVYFPAGKIRIGSSTGLPNEQPIFTTKVDAFFIDKHPVTVGDFRKFINAAGYTTDAEKFGDAGIFNLKTRQWELKKGAYWAYPMGTEESKAQEDHPVTQVSWRDARAYAQWAGKRLPTEIEWEYAARGGKSNNDIYSWGNKLVKNGKFQANVWQGNFPYHNEVKDGYRYTSPVGTFGETKKGLTDMGGNVWEWCQDTYHLYGKNPKNSKKKVIRGGSFMCHKSYCHGYRVSARQSGSLETGLFHQGFRCAGDAPH